MGNNVSNEPPPQQQQQQVEETKTQSTKPKSKKKKSTTSSTRHTHSPLIILADNPNKPSEDQYPDSKSKKKKKTKAAPTTSSKKSNTQKVVVVQRIDEYPARVLLHSPLMHPNYKDTSQKSPTMLVINDDQDFEDMNNTAKTTEKYFKPAREIKSYRMLDQTTSGDNVYVACTKENPFMSNTERELVSNDFGGLYKKKPFKYIWFIYRQKIDAINVVNEVSNQVLRDKLTDLLNISVDDADNKLRFTELDSMLPVYEITKIPKSERKTSSSTKKM